MKQILFLISFFILFVSWNVNAQSNQFFDDADKFFSTYVEDGLVVYQEVSNDKLQLNKLINQISEERPSKEEEKAFYINAYNLLVIKSIVEQYPVTSPNDIIGFFDKLKHNVSGRMITLNELENDYIRKKYNDARVHFVLVCGALGCPKISNHAYTPSKLEKQLDERTTLVLNDNYFIRVKSNSELVLVSQIFDWYQNDFKKEGISIIDYINQYREKDSLISKSFKWDYYPYSWKLNEKKKYK